MRLVSCSLAFSLLGLCAVVRANTEKVVFQAPLREHVPDTKPGLEVLNLPVLSPASSSKRLSLPRPFPTTSVPDGSHSWLILADLEPLCRYEVRICWTAIVSVPLRSLKRP